jgi:hypothetical protein
MTVLTGTHAQSHAVSDLIEPAAQRGPFRNGPSPSRKGQKSSLEGVFPVLGMLEQAAADAEHQTSVPPDQHHESCLVASADETFQQLSVRKVATSIGMDDASHALQECA